MITKIICSDIDGTLLNKERELSDRTIKVIKDNSETPFILISSRMPKAMVHLQRELDITHLPLIAYNGGLVIDNKDILHSTEISNTITNVIYNFCKTTSLHISLYHNDEWFVQELDYWANREANNTKIIPQINPIKNTINRWGSKNKGAHKIMCMGDENEIDTLILFLEEHYPSDIIGYRSKSTYLEIAPKDISKKTAIELLLKLKYPKLNLNNVIAFGDNYNDIEMIKAVGIGVAVNNAKPELLAVSNHTTLSNINDGVAVFLENYF